MPRPPRRFGGKIFRHDPPPRKTKKKAQERAKFLRSKGYNVRIVRAQPGGRYGSGKISKVYLVYKRKR